MHYAFELSKTSLTPRDEFMQAMKLYKEQHYPRMREDVNSLINDSGNLTKTQVWQGLKWKAQNPKRYFKLRESVIVPGSMSSDGDAFIRLSIQPSWATGKDVVVKEEVFMDEKTMNVYFMGQPVDPTEAKRYLKEFDEAMLKENPPLFHVIHGVEGTEEKPWVNWEMVRLAKLESVADKEISEQIRNMISGGNGRHIYLATLEQLKENKLTQKPS